MPAPAALVSRQIEGGQEKRLVMQAIQIPPQLLQLCDVLPAVARVSRRCADDSRGLVAPLVAAWQVEGLPLVLPSTCAQDRRPKTHSGVCYHRCSPFHVQCWSFETRGMPMVLANCSEEDAHAVQKRCP